MRFHMISRPRFTTQACMEASTTGKRKVESAILLIFEKETNNKPVAGSKKTLKDMQLCRISGPVLVQIDIKKNFWEETTLRD